MIRDAPPTELPPLFTPLTFRTQLIILHLLPLLNIADRQLNQLFLLIGSDSCSRCMLAQTQRSARCSLTARCRSLFELSGTAAHFSWLIAADWLLGRRLLSLPLRFAVPFRSASSARALPASSAAMSSSSSDKLHIEIISDTICPFCLIGKKKVEAAVAQLPPGVDVTYEWKPYQLDPTLPSPGVNKMQRYEKKFGAERIGPMLEGMKQRGQEYGSVAGKRESVFGGQK